MSTALIIIWAVTFVIFIGVNTCLLRELKRVLDQLHLTQLIVDDFEKQLRDVKKQLEGKLDKIGLSNINWNSNND